MRDSSLEDFAGDDEAVDTAESSDPDEAVSPAVSTYDWTPTGASCANCNAVVERRWRDGGDDGELVCFDCKTW